MEVEELVVYHGGLVQIEVIVVDRVVVGGKASPVVLEVYTEDDVVEEMELVVYHSGLDQVELVVDDRVVVGGNASPVVLDV